MVEFVLYDRCAWISMDLGYQDMRIVVVERVDWGPAIVVHRHIGSRIRYSLFVDARTTYFS